ncbi:MAG: DUF932 domain-containing protein [Burkholderiaceae bacterium]
MRTNFAPATYAVRSESPLSEREMRRAAPSIFAQGKHGSRSDRYAYVPTIEVLRELGRAGFDPFMVAQNQSRTASKAEFTKHLIRMRHASRNAGGDEVDEVILINSHDGASPYQMLAGVFRFACHNGLVVGTADHGVRIVHKGSILSDVIESAFQVLKVFDAVDESISGMKATTLDVDEQLVFARAAIYFRYGERTPWNPPAPVTPETLLEPRRPEDVGPNLWSTFQRVQENLVRGGQCGCRANGRRMQTRGVGSIDRSVELNRRLWVLAETTSIVHISSPAISEFANGNVRIGDPDRNPP